jgi:hypothetical protein
LLLPFVARSNAVPMIAAGFRGLPTYVSGAEGPERIAPAERPSQGESAIPPGSM